MRMKLRTLLAFCAFMLTFSFTNAQEDQSPEFISTVSEFRIVPPLSQQRRIVPDLVTKEVNNNRWLNYPTNFDAYPKGEDVLRQSERGAVQGRAPIVNIDGATVGIHTGAYPPDPTGAVGPNHYIHSYNSGFVIYDKSGNILQNHSSLSMIFPGESLGDPIVLYDRYVDRFVVTQFSNSPDGLLIAVAQGPDPVNDGWYTYRFDMDAFPDYPKYSIWHDGYYMTANKGGNHFYALERDKLIAGDNTAQIVGFTLPGISQNPNTVFAPLPMNSVGPNLPDASTPGYVTYLQDDAWAGTLQDHLKVWEVNLDWNNTANSTVSAPSQIVTTPFDSFTAAFGSGEIPQPGTTQRIDGITGVVSYNCNYYNFGTHNSVTLNFNVDVNSDNTILGIRWYELRENAGTWSIFQEGTYAPDDGLYRFMGSMSMDANGNMGLAFAVANATTFPSLRYTGRFATSPLGEMVVAEQTIVDGGGSQTNTNRFGDYAHLTLDPVDNQTFWFCSEYVNSQDQWRTRIASFKIAPDTPTDVGITGITAPTDATLSNAESITVTVFNFGTDSQSNIPVSYQIDGGAVVNEVYPGPLAPTESASYTFTTTANLGNEGQTYTILASTNLSGDSNTSNDPFSIDVTHLSPNDIGVTSINTPNTGTGLGVETIEITVENFGGLVQSNFDVSYSVNGVPVTEQIAGPLSPGESINYTFATPYDFSAFGTYEISATTLLSADSDTTNDEASKIVFHASCTPAALGATGSTNPDSGCGLDGIKRFVLGTIDVDDGANGCNSTGAVKGYVDRTHLSTDLDRLAGNNTHTLQAQHNWAGGATTEQLSVWIDFNDNGVFEGSEQLIIAENYSVAEALNDFDLAIPADAPLGSHILRARGIDPTGTPGDPNDPCADKQYGETHDYTVNIVDSSLSIDDYALNNSELIINDLGNESYEVILRPNGFTDMLTISMHNILGQKLVRNRVHYENGEYRYVLNTNGLASGVYLIRLGTEQYGKVKRIVIE